MDTWSLWRDCGWSGDALELWRLGLRWRGGLPVMLMSGLLLRTLRSMTIVSERGSCDVMPVNPALPVMLTPLLAPDPVPVPRPVLLAAAAACAAAAAAVT